MAQIAAECDDYGLKFEDGKVTHPEAAERVFHVFHDAGLPATGFPGVMAGWEYRMP